LNLQAAQIHSIILPEDKFIYSSTRKWTRLSWTHGFLGVESSQVREYRMLHSTWVGSHTLWQELPLQIPSAQLVLHRFWAGGFVHRRLQSSLQILKRTAIAAESEAQRKAVACLEAGSEAGI
jgi:hypothetical protein